MRDVLNAVCYVKFIVSYLCMKKFTRLPINQGFLHKAVVKVIETASCIYAVSENSRFSSMKEKDFSSKIDVTGYSHLL